jgi:hypothetical protein
MPGSIAVSQIPICVCCKSAILQAVYPFFGAKEQIFLNSQKGRFVSQMCLCVCVGQAPQTPFISYFTITTIRKNTSRCCASTFVIATRHRSRLHKSPPTLPLLPLHCCLASATISLTTWQDITWICDVNCHRRPTRGFLPSLQNALFSISASMPAWSFLQICELLAPKSKNAHNGVGCMAWEWICISLDSWMVVLIILVQKWNRTSPCLKLYIPCLKCFGTKCTYSAYLGSRVKPFFWTT